MSTAQIITPDQLQNEIVLLNKKLTESDEKIFCLEEQLAWFKRQLFGKKSEKTVSNLNSDQLFLAGFDGVPAAAQETEKTIPAHTRRKPNRNGQDKIKLPPDLPVVTTVLDLPEDQKICKETGIPLVKIGEEVTHRLAYTPGSYFIKEIIRKSVQNDW